MCLVILSDKELFTESIIILKSKQWFLFQSSKKCHVLYYSLIRDVFFCAFRSCPIHNVHYCHWVYKQCLLFLTIWENILWYFAQPKYWAVHKNISKQFSSSFNVSIFLLYSCWTKHYIVFSLHHPKEHKLHARMHFNYHSCFGLFAGWLVFGGHDDWWVLWRKTSQMWMKGFFIILWYASYTTYAN